MSRAVVLVVALLGCSSKSEPPPRPQPVTAAPMDAGIDGITSIGGWDPTSGMHLDDDSASERIPPTRTKNRPIRPIDITLKSTPPGAVAAVDGRQIGTTPVYWEGGEADGREHEFTFVLRGHAVARYRFVPIMSGIVHARLEAIAEPPAHGGLGPLIAPTFAPDAGVAPPPTVLTPIDAGARAVPPPVDPAPPSPPVPVDATAPLPDPSADGSGPPP